MNLPGRRCRAGKPPVLPPTWRQHCPPPRRAPSSNCPNCSNYPSCACYPRFLHCPRSTLLPHRHHHSPRPRVQTDSIVSIGQKPCCARVCLLLEPRKMLTRLVSSPPAKRSQPRNG